MCFCGTTTKKKSSAFDFINSNLKAKEEKKKKIRASNKTVTAFQVEVDCFFAIMEQINRIGHWMVCLFSFFFRKNVYLSIICSPRLAKYTTPCNVEPKKTCNTPLWTFFHNLNFLTFNKWVGRTDLNDVLLCSASRKITFLYRSTVVLLWIMALFSAFDSFVCVLLLRRTKFNSHQAIRCCVSNSRPPLSTRFLRPLFLPRMV